MDGQVLVQQPGKRRWTIVRCPSCGDTRSVTARQAYRQASGEASGLCRRCKNPPRTFDDVDDPRMERLRVWWLEQAGIRDLGGLDSRSYVRAHGCPELLAEVAKALENWPETE